MLLSTILRTASSKLKVYANIKLQDATPGIEGSINLPEGSDDPSQQKLPEKP
jgi:hypothetical protein